MIAARLWTVRVDLAYTPRMSVPALQWLHIHRYEQFEPVQIQFSSRENLLLGVNGAGKTRLLTLIRAVLSLDFGELLNRTFDVEFELHTMSAGTRDSGKVIVTGRVRNAHAVPQSSAEPAMLQPAMELTAKISYRRDDTVLRCEVRGNEMTYRHDGPKGTIEKALITGSGLLKPTHRDLQDPDIRSVVPLVYPQCEANYLGASDREFRILTQDLSFTVGSGSGASIRVTNDKGESLGHLLLWDLLPLVLALGKLDHTRLNDGLDLSEPGALNVIVPLDDAVFRRLFSSMGVRTVRLVPKIARTQGMEYECRGVDVRVRFLDETEVAESELTFGQRRYLYAGIVFALHPAAPVLVDEIDNGLHPQLIATLLDLWRDRQVFIVSHNKLVIDHTNFSGPLDVQEKVHIVRRAENGQQTVLSLDEAAALEIYEKIAVAIQSPSDVLRAEGLW